MLAAEQGRTWGYGSPAALTCYALGLTGLGAWLLIERRMGEEALIPLRLFRAAPFSLSALAGAALGAAMLGTMMTLPLYYQIVRGASPTRSGLMMLPLMAGLVLASALSGRVIARSGRYKAFFVTGLALVAVAALALSPLLDTDVPLIAVMGLAAVLGLGLGSSMQPLTLSVQAAAPVRDMGVATSAATFTRQLGGTAGIAGCVAVVFGRTGEIGDSSAMTASFAGSFAAAVRPVFLLVAILAAAGFLMALLIKELPLHPTTGPRARATEGITR
ncbi:MFS transporter [Nonomuraea sp. NPDC048901]|uniref:MFS transporter n=1 Tax=Nonomuraea sp. NPDC048901 TaxID=3155627 RepID=UPI0034062C71